MAIDSASIGADFSSYQGNPNLGAINAPAIKIDTRPFYELSAYVFAYNSTQFKAKQADMEAKAKQLADLTAYDLTTAIDKDRSEIQKGYDDLYNYVKSNPTVLDYTNNREGWMEYNKKRNELENKLSGAKVRDTLYKLRDKEVSDTTDPKLKALLKQRLNDEANSTSLDTPLKHTQLYDIAPVPIEAPPLRKFDVSRKAGDFISKRTTQLPDMESVESQASAKEFALLQNVTDEAAISALPPEEQKYARESAAMQSASGKLEPVESAKILSSVLLSPKFQDAKYKNPDGTMNLDALIKDNADNTLVGGSLSTIKQYNDKMAEMKAKIKAGEFTDSLGKTLSFGDGALNENHYREIDISDGISPKEILKVRIMGLAPASTFDTEIKQTDSAYKYAQLAETIRGKKASEALQGKEFKLNEDKWKASQVGGETQINGAMLRAKRIYADMLKLADKDGVISPDKLRRLNVEQLKYLGIEQPDEIDEASGKVIKGGFRALSFEDKDAEGKVINTPHAIQLVDGEVRILKDAKPSTTGSGRFIGQWDASKSTNVTNMATNILNEELQKAGSKELNTYMPIDAMNGDVSTNTFGGSNTQSGGTKEISRASIGEKAAAAGYSPKEYEKLLKEKGVKIID